VLFFIYEIFWLFFILMFTYIIIRKRFIKKIFTTKVIKEERSEKEEIMVKLI